MLAPASRLRSTSMIDARLELLKSAPRPLAQRARIRLHHGTAEVMARVVMLTGEQAAGSEESQRTRSRYLNPGESRVVKLGERLAVLPATASNQKLPPSHDRRRRLIDGLPTNTDAIETLAKVGATRRLDCEQSAIFIEMAASVRSAGELARPSCN